eukprot:1160768-Pelagomonas_calceolata.AAC.1
MRQCKKLWMRQMQQMRGVRVMQTSSCGAAANIERKAVCRLGALHQEARQSRANPQGLLEDEAPTSLPPPCCNPDKIDLNGAQRQATPTPCFIAFPWGSSICHHNSGLLITLP